ncbi:MAG: UDP-N-acetylglucosamine--N-acetylmuramyl-(pentapeptide) pyrophosphoryl-undecaprenol N-acetylglucosamine transferase [Clostridiales bacterium]|nr:UDP-N-acetylglucosamine--N-acetylmuramyl-(pentapeptide) pyrophosphoryl-undecaprenol N-acetylglucosamine transferase [Clostridiales bacterium]
MKILLAGGGTAGHCVPNLALLPELKKHFSDIRYIGTEKGIERTLVHPYGLTYYPINTPKFVRGLSFRALKNNLGIPFSLTRAKKRCVQILKEFQPNVVFLKGGFVCLPVALACKKMKIPCVIHESDYSFGLANRLCLPFAKKILTAFPQTAQKKKRALFVGAPLREELFRVPKSKGRTRYGFSADKRVLLILGGSSGAQGLNALIKESLPYLLTEFQVLHVVGKKETLPEKQEGYVPLAYEGEMGYAYAAADLAISRAGANALFELTALGVPTLAVPLPTGRGDQKENARYFENAGAILQVEESALNKENILPHLHNLITKTPSLQNNMLALGNTETCQRIVKEIVRAAKRES